MNPIKYYIADSADIIKKRSKFLIEHGFKLICENEFSIIYENEIISFGIVFERYSEHSDINIRFLKENKSFSVGWIIRMYDSVDFNDYLLNKPDKLITVLGSLNFIEEHYDKVIDINFCEKMISRVQDFLSNNERSN